MSSERKRVCIIGAGPCGMAAIYNFDQMKRDNVPNVPEFICYEKQATWGGLWNFSWRTGLDEFGEPCPHGMYRHLWSNSPKEGIEFPDYTFEGHFGKPIPSFPPRAVIRDYLEGKWKKDGRDLRHYIKFRTIVKDVQYNKDTDDFTVKTKNMVDDRDEMLERFTHVIVAVGIFNTPNTPHFEGMDTFPGKVMHSHDFRGAEEFKKMKLLIIGASYSAEDIALHCKKFGADDIICSWKTKPMGLEWPKGIEERPLVQEIHDKTVSFIDGTVAEVDAIILCTGYIFHYPFLPDELRLKCDLSLYSPNLYNGTVWLNGGGRKLLYLGAYGQYFSFTLFDAQSLWACKYIIGDLPDNEMSQEEMRADSDKWRKRALEITNAADGIDFQTDYLTELSFHTNYPKDAAKAGVYYKEWQVDKAHDILTYRDKPFDSIYSKSQTPVHHTTFMMAFDDSLATFVNQTPNKESN